MATTEIKVDGIRQLLSKLNGLTPKAQRGALRAMTSKAGVLLSREIRRQIKRRDMPYSRARNPAERRAAKGRGQTPLAYTIKKRAWKKPQKGIIGTVVGPAYPAGAHGHLAEFGHKITGHSRIKFRGVSLKALRRKKWKRKTVRLGRRSVARSGERTIAHGFQQQAMDETSGEIYGAMREGWRRFIAKQNKVN